MANKSEKVKISFGDKAQADSLPRITSISHSTAESKVAHSSSFHHKGTLRARSNSNTTAPQSASILDHPDVRQLDGGFSSDLYPTTDEDISQSKEQETVAGNNPPTEQPATDASSDQPEDFYTSKFNPEVANPRQREVAGSGKVKVRPYTLVRFWLILLVFILTSITGLVMLYQLEQVQPGSGIIFDWYRYLTGAS